jgi:hypothetical protein
MSRLLEVGPLYQSAIAAVLLALIWLAVPVFSKKLGVSPEVFLVWYFLGVILMTGAYSRDELFSPSPWIIAAMIGIGLLPGFVANVLVFAATTAPGNPGIALTIVQANSVLVLLGGLLLAQFAPSFIQKIEVHPYSYVGAGIVFMGLTLMALAPKK